MTRTNCDVLIIGLGPVGATLANILGAFGIETLVVERQPEAYRLPRAVSMDDETMRVFQSIGLSDEVERITAVGEGADFVDPSGRTLLTWHRPPVKTSNGWYVNYRFHQPALEQVLRDGMARYDCVIQRTGTEVTGLSDDDNGVTATCLEAGGTTSIRTQFVVGCDGANSFTRAAMGTDYVDLGFEEPWVVVDLALKNKRQDLAPRSTHYCDPERAASNVFLGRGRRRWEFRLKKGENPDTITRPENIWKLLAQWIGPEEAELERAVVYTFRSAVAGAWKKGRVLIAGDAAHLTPPFMGQGMCAGIRDVSNLGWKLARVIRKKAQIDILDTYQSERESHVRTFIELTMQMGRMINTTASALSAGDVVDADDGRQEMSQLKPGLGPGLGAGSSNVTGQLFPQLRLSSGELLDDRIGNRFGLLLDPRHETATVQASVNDDIMTITDSAAEYVEWFATSGLSAVLLRPDRYVLGGAADNAGVRDLLKSLAT